MRTGPNSYGAGGGGPTADPQRERTIDLLIDRAVAGELDPQSERELDGLLAERPELDDGSYERAVAALTLALVSETPQELPFDLRRRLEEA